ncbi:MAG TPA: hypothetical protein VIL71_22220 [Spirillospora sp.]
MTLSRRTKILIVGAGLAGTGMVAGAGAALADAGEDPRPVHTRFQIVEHKAAQTDAPDHRDCPGKNGTGAESGTAAAEGTQ